MDLRNWEHNATSGSPVSGATVEVREATLTSPNTGPVLASGNTNGDGMWEFAGLTDTPKDIKVIYSGMIWWHKGLTKHSVSQIYFVNPSARTDQFFQNAGFEINRGGTYVVTNVAQTIFDTWSAINGVGSSATISSETTIRANNSDVSMKIIQTKVAGSLSVHQNRPAAAMRGKQYSVSFQVHQSVASQVRAFIADSVGSNYSSYSATTGSWITMTVTRTIDSNALTVTAGIQIDASGTFYLDNAVWNAGPVAASYESEYFGAGSIHAGLLANDSVLTRNIIDLQVTAPKLANLAVTNAKMAAGAAAANIGYTPANRAGDSFTGQVSVSHNLSQYIGTYTRNINVAGADSLVLVGTSTESIAMGLTQGVYKYVVKDTGGTIYLAHNGVNLLVGGHAVYHAGNFNPANYQPAGAYAAATHTHTQAQSHGSADTDAATTSLHHTLGVGAHQASAGTHLHTGVYEAAGHDHAGVYEPAGSYAAATHSHAGVYQPVGNYASTGTTNQFSMEQRFDVAPRLQDLQIGFTAVPANFSGYFRFKDSGGITRAVPFL